MGLLTKEVTIKWHPNNKKWYESKGYIYTKMHDGLKVKIDDLITSSPVIVNVQCDGCQKISSVKWVSYKRYVKNDNKTYCNKCSHLLFGVEKTRISQLENGLSFEKWCFENNRKDILDRWDYDLNKYSPSEISYRSNKKFWIKCPEGVHKSESKNINNFTKGHNGSLDCKGCNSFAQWGVDNLGNSFLEKYWYYDKNININPWIISRGGNKKVWIKCQKKEYHKSYEVSCGVFASGSRCPYCINRKVHYLDSLGMLYPKTLEVWSNKNTKTPYEYSPMSDKIVWWKCPDGKHEDFKREIEDSNRVGFRCSSCSFSKGEAEIERCLRLYNIEYIPQKTFNGLIGLGNGLLSYDFYLQNYNILIEFQGEQHKRYIKGFHKTKKDFETQQEHDFRKREYAQEHNIKLLEIWYYDFKNIDEILRKEGCNGNTVY